jgi:hypothetical protein
MNEISVGVIKIYIFIFMTFAFMIIKCADVKENNSNFDLNKTESASPQNLIADSSGRDIRTTEISQIIPKLNSDFLAENLMNFNKLDVKSNEDKFRTKCSEFFENCAECEEEQNNIINGNHKLLTRFNTNSNITNKFKCILCEDNFLIYEGKCYGMINIDVICLYNTI